MSQEKKPSRKEGSRLAFRGGTYSLLTTALVLAILLAGNLLVSALPPSLTRLDTSASKLYSITSNTKTVVNNLDQDVTIYWITQAGEEDPVLRNLLSKYESLSDHITLVKKNPDVYPTFARQYTDEPVENNSLVVESGSRSRFIGLEDIYLAQPNLTNYTVDASFDGEGAITSAVDYVVNAELPRIYALEGHGEPELPEFFLEQLEKSNLELTRFSLLNVEEIPEEADCVMIYGPETDLSSREAELLSDYARRGGRLLVIAGPSPEAELPNLFGILSEYGVETVPGIVVEQDRAHYAFRVPHVLMPIMNGSPVTDPLLEEHYYPIVPVCAGFLLPETPAEGVITPLLTTSDTAFSKAEGFALTTYEKEPGDREGPFTLGLSIETGQGGKILWFGSSALLDEVYNAYSSGANVNLTLNALSSLLGEREALAIRSKSLNYNYLTISQSAASALKVLLIGIFPLTLLGAGVWVVLQRREKLRKNSEPEKGEAI